MNNTPKCPGCGRKMVLREDFHKFFFVCLDCGWKSPYGQNEKEGLDLALKRVEPKNRVLTLEEVDAHCEGGADAAPLWVEFDGGTNGWVLIAPVRETRKMDFVSKLLVTMGILYGKEWRCWLRKPTEEERRETPWAGDGRE